MLSGISLFSAVFFLFSEQNYAENKFCCCLCTLQKQLQECSESSDPYPYLNRAAFLPDVTQIIILFPVFSDSESFSVSAARQQLLYILCVPCSAGTGI